MTNQSRNLANLIMSRRTIHNFVPDKVQDISLIKEAIEIACWAPNHHLTEPWRFYLLGSETITSVCDLNKKILTASSSSDAAQKKYLRWLNIPGWLIVTCRKSANELTYYEDYAACCCVIQNFMLYLWSNGIGTKWSTGDIIRDDEFYDIIWVNKDLENVVGIIWYGYSEDTPKTTRKNISKTLIELP